MSTKRSKPSTAMAVMGATSMEKKGKVHMGISFSAMIAWFQ